MPHSVEAGTAPAARYFNASAARPALQWSWVALSGRDARDFLHRLTTVNVAALETGQGSPGFFLNPQGKIRSFFTLWRFATEDFAFEFDAGASGHWKQELLTAIDQYTFAEKFTISDISSTGAAEQSPLETRWIFADAEGESQVLAALGTPSLKARETVAIDEEIRVCHHGSIDFGRLWITVWGRTARLNQWFERTLPKATQVDEKEIEEWRIQAMRPRVDAEITSSTIPLEAGLIDAIAQSKGCYPGQEVIERIVSLGSPARRLARIEGQGTAPVPGEAIVNLAEPPAEVGQVTSVVKPEGTEGFVALGYVRKIHAKEGLEVRFINAGSQGAITRVAPYA